MKYFKHQMILNLLFKDRIYKGLDFNDDLKVFKYDDIKINFYNLSLIIFYIKRFVKERKSSV